jgi:hypothetical protein
MLDPGERIASDGGVLSGVAGCVGVDGCVGCEGWEGRTGCVGVGVGVDVGGVLVDDGAP